MSKSFDYLVLGGGILGLSISRALKLKFPYAKIAILDKESEFGMHQSGRSGGVIQPGFFHASDPFKIKLTRRGNILLTKFCEDQKLPLCKCGQFIIAKNDHEIEGLREMERRAKIGDIPIEWMDVEKVRKIDPNVKTHKLAIFCPSASSIDPKIICDSLGKVNQELGISTHLNTKYLKRMGNGIMTNKGLFEYKNIIVAAGCYSDQISHDFDIGLQYKMVPFTIHFAKSLQPTNELKTTVFSIPNFDFPYLEVKQSYMPDGKVKIGPSATPAIGRESHLGFKRVKLSELISCLYGDLQVLLLYNNSKMNYIKIALEEYRKRILRNMVKDANKQLYQDYKAKFGWDKKGVIANLFDTEKKLYVEDLIILKNGNATHILNTVFPGYTTAMSTAEIICNNF